MKFWLKTNISLTGPFISKEKLAKHAIEHRITNYSISKVSEKKLRQHECSHSN